MKRSRLSMVFTALILLFAVIVLAPQVSAIEDSDLCYEYTPQMVENTFRYLDEFYIDRYPEAALRVDVGRQEDKDNLKKFSDILCKDCTTDMEKAMAVFNWIKDNVEFGGGFYSYDVFYTRYGSCAAQANFMRDMLRYQGIPAVYAGGWREDCQSLTVGELRDLWEGHAWCFAYIDGEWILFDPLWSMEGITDRDFMAKNYIMDMVEHVVPALSLDTLPPLTPQPYMAYIDGKIMGINNNQITDTGVSYTINDVHNVRFETCGGANSYGLIYGEAYHDMWRWSGNEYTGAYRENGASYPLGIFEHDGVKYFSNGIFLHLLLADESDFFLQYGQFHVEPGFSGKLIEPQRYQAIKDDDE